MSHLLIFDPDEQDHLVKTRTGRGIKTVQAGEVSEQLKRGDVIQHRKHGLAQPRIEECTGSYNCHGLVFASRRASIEDTSQIPWILTEDGYYEVAPDRLLAGDIAVYRNEQNGDASHSAIVVATGEPQPMVVSKWGPGREYVHGLWDCPYGGKITFYRIRR